MAAIAVSDAGSDEQTEKLVTIVELKNGDDADTLAVVKSDVVAAISVRTVCRSLISCWWNRGPSRPPPAARSASLRALEQHRQGRFVRLDA